MSRAPPGRPILFELARLAAVVALPLLGVIAFLLFDAARRDLAHATDDTRRVADETAARSERFLGDFRATLETIAQRPLVRAMDPAALRPRAVDIARSLSARRQHHRGRCRRLDSLRRQAAAERRAAARGGHGAAKRRHSRRHVPSFATADRQNQRTWGVTAVQPVSSDDGRVIGAVGMQVNLRQLQPFGSVDRRARHRRNRRPSGHRDRALGRAGRMDRQRRERHTGDRLDARTQRRTVARRGLRRQGSAVGVPSGRRHDWIAYAGVDAESAIAPRADAGIAALLFVAVIVGATFARSRHMRPDASRDRSRAIAEVARARASGARDARAAIEGSARSRRRRSRVQRRPREAAAAVEPPGPVAPDHARDRRAARPAQHLPGRDPQSRSGSADRLRLHLPVRRSGSHVRS